MTNYYNYAYNVITRTNITNTASYTIINITIQYELLDYYDYDYYY